MPRTVLHADKLAMLNSTSKIIQNFFIMHL